MASSHTRGAPQKIGFQQKDGTIVQRVMVPLLDEMGNRVGWDFNRPGCGCCSNGCLCRMHMDIPRGRLPGKCEACRRG